MYHSLVQDGRIPFEVPLTTENNTILEWERACDGLHIQNFKLKCQIDW